MRPKVDNGYERQFTYVYGAVNPLQGVLALSNAPMAATHSNVRAKVDQPPVEVRELFGDAYADVGDVASRRAAIHAAGYRLLTDFVLPVSAWWDNYYVPLGHSVQRFRAAHAGNDAALAVAARSGHEIAVYRRHADSFGYAFS